MTALRRAVHALHVESEQEESNSSAGWWRRGAPMQSAVARLGLTLDKRDGSPDRIVALLVQLRLATTHYAVALRTEGESPERMLVRMKAVMRDVLIAERWFDRTATRPIVCAVVVWSIDAYYGR